MATATADTIVQRVAKLLERADHAGTNDAERDACLAKADALMAKHMIDEAVLRAAQTPEERRRPVVVEVNELLNLSNVWGVKMRTIAEQVARTVGVKLVIRYSTGAGRTVTLVGFDEDVRWMQMLFTNIKMAFLTRITPQWEAQRDFAANVALLRESGMSWSRVLDRAVRAGAVEDSWSELSDWAGTWQGRDLDKYVTHRQAARWSAEDKLNRVYRNWCKEAGVKPVQVTRHEAYRQTYAEAFTLRICSRLEEMKEARKAGDPGTELALRTVEADVLQALYDTFPDMSPEAREARVAAMVEQQRKADEALAERLAAMTPAQRMRWEKEQAAERDKQARANDRYWRRAEKESERLYDANGLRAGKAAADGVNLSTAETVDATARGQLA